MPRDTLIIEGMASGPVSYTHLLETALRLLGIGPGDEVVTSAYTYTASASVIAHVGAKIVLADVAQDSYEMDYERLESIITEHTKAIIPVDLGGVPCNYEKIFDIVERKKMCIRDRRWSDCCVRRCRDERCAPVCDCGGSTGKNSQISVFTGDYRQAEKNTLVGTGRCVRA